MEKKINVYKLNHDIQRLVKMGLPENMATIVASANNGVPEIAQHYITEIEDEQSLIKEEISRFVPFDENEHYRDHIYQELTNESSTENKITTIQH
jgi:hypothetical protein